MDRALAKSPDQLLSERTQKVVGNTKLRSSALRHKWVHSNWAVGSRP